MACCMVLKEEELSEREAARMLERMRATEEDEEFERAFRSMVRFAMMEYLLVDSNSLHSYDDMPCDMM